MSSFVYGRYTGTEAAAAVRGGKPMVVVEKSDGTIDADPQDKPKQTLNFAGIVGDKVLALFPAEGLALYTMISDPTENTGNVFNFRLGEWFWIMLVFASIVYVFGRFSAGKYRFLSYVIRHGGYTWKRKFKYSVAELLRIIVPAVAVASWLLGGETDMDKAASLPDWGLLDWTETKKIAMQGWAIILFGAATTFAWIAGRIGFN